MSDAAPLELRAVRRSFRTEAGELPVLRGADLTLAAGEIVALVAPSGTGKSTLLHLAGLLEKPDGGEVFVGGQAAGTLSDDQRTAIRRTTIGFVYQFHHLLPEFTALENIALPQMAAGTARAAADARAAELLHAFGLAGREAHRPGKLSGGEQQRVAIARALA
ncbi:ABC transporter ATP-binding protein, partial [Falsiroseomonas oryziterrae]|uniref:ABC transporter ATP-binding protein n=1 Tax=Falsiroseomonas oryziterrae TaxID=2911368 RepID=UPI001F01EF8E